jgi:hypothetical protein
MAATLGAKVIVGGDRSNSKTSIEAPLSYDRHCANFRDFANVQHDVTIKQPNSTDEKRN